MMIFLPLVLLALLPAADAYYFDKRYFSDKYFIYVTYKVRTYDAWFAGTDSYMRFSFGYVNETTNKLVYFYENPPIRPGDGHFEAGQVDNYHDTLKDSRYRKIEEECGRETSTEDEYLACLTRPNIVFIEMIKNYKKGWDVDREWLPDKFDVTVGVHHWENGVWAGDVSGQSQFLVNGDWLDGTSSYYLRATKNGERCSVHKGTAKIANRYSKCR
ncbi:hypothetical protein QR680_014323 [Steinernema hermaphroditum]|uniref:C-type lectin domain-containing protein n=1 Tax=Steinernema hermaphroditum TaxID=289476 RepID=A0AA39I8I7_9BILA|nr:hypothetical protein QR680_014323 [Steinernema hermaphroditum]